MKRTYLAVLTRPSFPFHAEISTRLGELTFQNETEYSWLRPTLFFCKDSLDLTRQLQVEEAHDNGYPVIVTIGTHATLTVLEHCKKLNLSIPIIYAGVGSPEQLGLTSETYPITGIIREPVPTTLGLQLFHTLKPKMKRILIPYDQNGDAFRLKEEIIKAKEYFTKNGVDVVAYPFQDIRNDFEKIKHTMLEKEVDTLTYLEACLCEGMAQALGSICEQYSVTYFAPTQSALNFGASAVFAESVSHMADHILKLASTIITSGIHASKIKLIALPNKRKLIVNTDKISSADSGLPQTLLYCLNGTRFY